MLALCEFGRAARRATLYWNTHGSTNGNNASTGANLGGSGIWNLGNSNWWDAIVGAPQAWTDGSDAVFWGTAGGVGVSAVSANSVGFKTTGYSLSGGTLTTIGAASFNVDTDVTATISSSITGTNTLWKVGAGTLILVSRSPTLQISPFVSCLTAWRTWLMPAQSAGPERSSSRPQGGWC